MSQVQMREALVIARAGLVWYQENYPETFSECDNEALEQIDTALAAVPAELSSNPLQLQSQTQQDHIPDATKMAQPIADTDSAREYLVENLLPKFSDSTFSVYVRSALAGDFAYQLAVYLQSQAQQEPSKATNLFEIVTHGESGDAWLLLRADVNFGLGHHCIKFEGAAADDLRKRFKVMGGMQSQAQQEPVSKDWAEDFSHENGMYQSVCCVCECTFIGHKRRGICKACAQPPAPEGGNHIGDTNKMVNTTHVCAFSRSVLDGETETCSCGAWR